MPKLLLVSYQFPPSGGVGVQRALSFAKYFPECGIETFVLTARNAVTPVKDPSLVAQVPAAVHVSATFTPEIPYAVREKIWSRMGGAKAPGGESAPSTKDSLPKPSGLKALARGLIERAVCPDPQIVWNRFAIGEGTRLIRRHAIDAVLVSVPPFSSLHIGIELKRRFPRVKLITDFRDEWLNHYMRADRSASEYKRRYAVRLERDAVAASDFVVAATEGMLGDIRERHRDLPGSRFFAIANGYDPAAFAGFTTRSNGTGRMVITYVGSVYGNPTYSPRTFVDALNRLSDDVRAKIELRFIGRVADGQDQVLREARTNVQLLGFLPQGEAFRRMEETDCLLLIVNSMTSASGKLLEYLATGKPILAVTPARGEIAQVLAASRNGWCADAADVEGIRAMLATAFEHWSNGWRDTPAANPEVIRAFERPRLARELVRRAGLIPA